MDITTFNNKADDLSDPSLQKENLQEFLTNQKSDNESFELFDIDAKYLRSL